MKETEDAPLQSQPPNRARTFVLTLALAAAAFAAGYIPKSLEARRLNDALATMRVDLKLANLHRQLGVATEEAQRNNFASAANAARAFFDGCRTVAGDPAFANQPRTRAALEGYAGWRDEIMGLLASADPTVKDKLAGMYLAMDGVIQRRL